MDPGKPTREKSVAELLAEAHQYSAELRALLVAEISPNTVSLIAKIPYKAVVLRESLAHRTADLAEAACTLFSMERSLPAFVLTRAVFESAAASFLLHKKVETAIGARSIAPLDDFLMAGLFGQRTEDARVKATNVLNAVDALDEYSPGMRAWYGGLCEYAHPNYEGTMLAYTIAPTIAMVA